VTSKFRIAALVEAVSYLVLLSAVFVKRVLEGGDAVKVIGPIHGIAFLVYFVLVLMVREEQEWSVGQTLIVLIASALPFGGFVVNRRMVRDPDAAVAR